ncbi:MAG: response regulator, partial [Planctomycetota bacterium]
VNAVATAADLCGELADIVEPTVSAPKVVDVNRLIEKFGTVLKSSVPSEIELDVGKTDSDSAELLVKVEPANLKRAVLNLVVNAGEAASRFVSIQAYRKKIAESELVEARFVDSEPAPGEFVCIQINDDGPGVDEDAMPWLFDPYFSTKELGRGLGLSIVLRTLSRQGGILFVDSKDEGASFSICLPVVEGVPANEDAVASFQSAENLNILVVDDNHLVLESVSSLLKLSGHTVTGFDSCGTALDAIRNGPHFNLVLLDISMPDITGVDCAARILAESPRLPILFFSGYGAEEIPPQMLMKPNIDFMRKPFTQEQFQMKLQELLRAIETASSASTGSEA